MLYAGEETVQLTWMDAKIGDWVITPRIGKAVRLMPFGITTLCIMTDFAYQLGKTSPAEQYKESAKWVKTGFQRFWNESRACLYDVIDGSEGDIGQDGMRYDERLRPNQLFAVSLPNSPLDATRQKAIVDIFARELITSYGLRSLAIPPAIKVADAAYHQGTVWAWLMSSGISTPMDKSSPMNRHLMISIRSFTSQKYISLLRVLLLPLGFDCAFPQSWLYQW